MNKRNNADKSMIFFKIGLLLFVYTTAILLCCIFSRRFAELYCLSVSEFLRYILSLISGIFPFSLAEVLLFVLPVVWLFLEIKLIIKKQFRFRRFILRVALFVFAAYFLFVNLFGVCYVRRPLEENMGFAVSEFSDNELKKSAEFIRNRLEATLDKVTFSDNGASVNPHSWDELNKKIDIGFDAMEKEYPFISRINAPAKKILLSPIMTYTHISGVFIPFTAEANVNTNYPDYVVAFSTAHEKAHQRGIAEEDEANFVAFLSCLASDDEYLVYASLLSMYDYYLDAAYEADREMYFELLDSTDRRVLGEMYAYSVFFDKYRNSAASQVADTINDSYIKTMGDSEGVNSYGRVVELCTSYLIQKEALPY